MSLVNSGERSYRLVNYAGAIAGTLFGAWVSFSTPLGTGIGALLGFLALGLGEAIQGLFGLASNAGFYLAAIWFVAVAASLCRIVWRVGRDGYWEYRDKPEWGGFAFFFWLHTVALMAPVSIILHPPFHH